MAPSGQSCLVNYTVLHCLKEVSLTLRSSSHFLFSSWTLPPQGFPSQHLHALSTQLLNLTVWHYQFSSQCLVISFLFLLASELSRRR